MNSLGRHFFTRITGGQNSNKAQRVRSGKTGQAKELYSAEQLARIDSFMLDALTKMNSDFP